jgi:hypothetical protein
VEIYFVPAIQHLHFQKVIMLFESYIHDMSEGQQVYAQRFQASQQFRNQYITQTKIVDHLWPSDHEVSGTNKPQFML